MSEPKKKDQVTEPLGMSARDKRAERKQKAEKEARKSRNTYIAVGIACLALAIFAIAWGSGIIQRSMTAVSINGHNYTAAEVQYYYNNILNMYRSYGLISSTTDPRDQVIDEESGQTLYDSMLESAFSSLTSIAATCDKAKEAGFTMPDVYRQMLDEQVKSLDENWKSQGFASRAAMIRGYYGNYMTYGKLVDLMEQQFLAQAYQDSVQDSFTYTDEDLEGYYDENKDSMDTFTLTTYTITATLPEEEESDDDSSDGDSSEAAEMTDEEKEAALEEAKTAAKAIADEIQEKLEAEDADAEAIAKEYEDQISSSSVSASLLGSSVSSTYSEWVFDSARKNGDISIQENEGSSDDTYYYYVLRWEGRERVEDLTNSARVILVAAEQDEDADAPTDEQYNAAKEEAQAILDEWNAGEKTEDSFADLAMLKSDDYSSSYGGLLTNITDASSYAFADWVTDSARKTGDTELIQDTTSTTKGWYVVYYKQDEPRWKQTADSALRSEDMNEWSTSSVEGYTATQKTGMKFVSA